MNSAYKNKFFAPDPIFDDALITSILRYKDSDCIVRMLTKNHGRITGFFKGGVKVSKKNISVVQAPSVAQVAFLPQKNEDMAKIYSCDLDSVSFSFALSPKIFGLCSYLCEIIEIFLPLMDPAKKIYDLSLEVFNLLSLTKQPPLLLRAFELHLLDFAGYLPDLNPDIKNAIKAYNLDLGIFTQETQNNSIDFSPEALKLAHTLFTKPLGDLTLEPCEKELLMIARIFHCRLKAIHPKPLNSVLFLKSLSS